MDKKYLDKVVNQIMSETIIEDSENNYGGNNSFIKRRIRWAFQPIFTNPYHVNNHEFIKYCKDVYGLNYDETEYVWEEYKEIIRVKIENNGL
mgnify:CR=1 FL=1